jgi:hypothetical protein
MPVLFFSHALILNKNPHLWMGTIIHLKNRILAQSQGGTGFQPADILKYFDELKRDPNTEIVTKDFVEMASKKVLSL